jgi:hypothetical protein
MTLPLDDDRRDDTERNDETHPNACTAIVSNIREHLREPIGRKNGYSSRLLHSSRRAVTYQNGPMKPQVCLTKVINTPTLAASTR